MNFVKTCLALALMGICSCSDTSSNENNVEVESSYSGSTLGEKELHLKVSDARKGDANAAYSLAEHFASLGPDYLEANVFWLEKSARLGNAEAMAEVVSSNLANGLCEEALNSLHKFEKADQYRKNSLKMQKSDVEDCFKRPFGAGDWNTRQGGDENNSIEKG